MWTPSQLGRMIPHCYKVLKDSNRRLRAKIKHVRRHIRLSERVIKAMRDPGLSHQIVVRLRLDKSINQIAHSLRDGRFANLGAQRPSIVIVDWVSTFGVTPSCLD